MSGEERCVQMGAGGGLIDLDGRPVVPPEGWAFLPAGDAGLTRKVTARSGFWRVQARMGRRTISRGIWAPEAIIAACRAEVEAIRATGAYQRKLAGARQRRAEQQSVYEGEFYRAVRAYLAFAPQHEELERIMAAAVTRHAVPVGSGTVARTAMLPIEERAARAVIAWMRHHTTAYDAMTIARIKGERRQVRRQLAKRSAALLQAYRQGQATPADCPLHQALQKMQAAERSAA
jgi:hypothetical protein